MTFLSEHFTLRELERSATARRLGISNTAPNAAVVHLQQLCTHVLEPLRMDYGRPIRIGSGYRCPELNKAIGGATSSQHMSGKAADITSLHDERDENLQLLRTLITSGLEYDQCICEFPDAFGRPDWVHVSWDADKPRQRRAFLVCTRYGGRTHYERMKPEDYLARVDCGHYVNY